MKFAKIAAESFPEISVKHSISAVPTVLLFKNGSVVDRVDGANAAELTKKVKQMVRRTYLSITPQSKRISGYTI